MSEVYKRKRRTGMLGWLLTALNLQPRYAHVPTIGVQGAGKSYFIFSNGYFISKRGLGQLVGQNQDYLDSLQPVIMRREPLDATQGYKDLSLLVEHIYDADFQRIADEVGCEKLGIATSEPATQGEASPTDEAKLRCNILMTTNDLSGLEFAQAMQRLREPNAELGGDPVTRNFLDVVRNADGLTVIVDIVRGIQSQEEFAREAEAHIRHAFAEQVEPLARGIELAISRQRRRSRRGAFPVFLVFTKRDIHGLGRERLEEMTDVIFALMLARLRRSNVQIRIHSVQSMGFKQAGESDTLLNSDSVGIGLYLADLFYWMKQ